MTGEVAERRYNGHAVRHDGDQRYHCLARTVLGEPCRNLTRWFYLPRNSHLCLSHIRSREAEPSRPRGGSKCSGRD